MFTISLEQKSKIASMCSFASGKINPIFEQVRIESNGETVRFSASNGVQYSSILLDANVQEEVSFCVSSKRLEVVTTALASDNAKFTLKDGSLIVTSGRSRLKLQTFSSKEYPDMESVTAQSRITLTIGQLTQMVNQASYCVANGDVRNYLCHMNWKIYDDHSVTVCATDGHRLSQIHQCVTSSQGTGSYLLPTSLFQAILSLKLDHNEQCEILFSESKASVTVPNFELVSTLGDGKYPDINRVIPTDYTNKGTFNLEAITNLAKRVNAVAVLEKNPVIKFTFKTTGVCMLEVNSPIKGDEFCETIDLNSFCLEDDFSIGVNSKYLVDALSKQIGEEVTFILNHHSAIKILSDQENLITLVMPVRY